MRSIGFAGGESDASQQGTFGATCTWRSDWLLRWLEVKKAAPGLADAILIDPDILDHYNDDLDTVLGSGLDRELHGIVRRPFGVDDALSDIDRLYRSRKLLVGVGLLLGRLPVAQAGRIYADLAERILKAVVDVCEADFFGRHGRITGGRHALVALGRFGGRDLTATSDLDLLFLYDFDADQPTSDGAQPLEGAQYYSRLAQRIIAAATRNCGHGRLFEVDFRLRPWGSKGPIATRLSSLRDYFATEAWTFEAMALTRARVIASTDEFATEIEVTLRRAILTTATLRDVRQDIATMRRLVQQEKASRRMWDIKCVAGGLMDIDFIVQGLTLAHTPAFAGRPMNDSAEAIAVLARAKAVPAADAQLLGEALALYQATIQLLRIATPEDAADMPEDLAALMAQRTGSGDLRHLQIRLRRLQREVRRIFDAVIVRGRRRGRFTRQAA